MASMLSSSFVTILVIIAILMGITFFLSYKYKDLVKNNVMTKGMNGVSGATLNLSCPSGQVISFKPGNATMYKGGNGRGVLICANGGTSCDPFWQPGGGQQTVSFFNTSNTIDALTSNLPAFTDLKGCEGKQTCSWTIPSSDPTQNGMCGGTAKCTGQLQFIGTYDCVPS